MQPLWEISSPASAQENMDEDLRRLLHLQAGDPPFLRFYQWKTPSLTYGYFTKPEEGIDVEKALKAGFDMGRRPTGGGVLFHTHDLAFSVLIPKDHPLLTSNTLHNYLLINEMVKNAVSMSLPCEASLLVQCQKNSSFCMAQPTIYDVMVGDKKVGGAAQRRTKTGLLHQGTLCLREPCPETLSPLLKDPTLFAAMQKVSFPLNVPQELLINSLKTSFFDTFRETA